MASLSRTSGRWRRAPPQDHCERTNSFPREQRCVAKFASPNPSSRPKPICHPDRRERRDRSGRISDSFAKRSRYRFPVSASHRRSSPTTEAKSGYWVQGSAPAAPRAAENQQLVLPAKFSSSRFNRAASSRDYIGSMSMCRPAVAAPSERNGQLSQRLRRHKHQIIRIDTR